MCSYCWQKNTRVHTISFKHTHILLQKFPEVKHFRAISVQHVYEHILKGQGGVKVNCNLVP